MKLKSIKGLLPDHSKLDYVGDYHNIIHNTDKNKHCVGFNMAIDQIGEKDFTINVEKVAKKLYEMHNYSRTFESNKPTWEELSEDNKDLSGFRWQAREIANQDELFECK